MPPGISYDLTALPVTAENCDVASIRRRTGGFNLEDASLVSGSYLPPLAPLAINFATRKAVAVKSVKVVENAAANATAIKVKKDSLAYVGMFVGDGTKSAAVTAINKTNAAYDTLTVSLTAAVTAGQVLFETVDGTGTTPKNKATHLNYARTKVETGAIVDAIFAVDEVIESKLTVPLSTPDKVNLGGRFDII